MREISKRILIVCEDEKSSKLYFESFKKDEKWRRNLASVDIKVVHPRDHSPVGLVEEAKWLKKKAKRERNPYNEVWVVPDRDGHAGMDKAFNMAKDNNITMALSVVCFETWILLHFEKSAKAFQKCADVIKYIKKNYFSDYEKKSNDFTLLHSKIDTAIKNAEWLFKQNRNELERGKKKYELETHTDIHLIVKNLITPQKIIRK